VNKKDCKYRHCINVEVVLAKHSTLRERLAHNHRVI
jgi:hypothetical protein